MGNNLFFTELTYDRACVRLLSNSSYKQKGKDTYQLPFGRAVSLQIALAITLGDCSSVLFPI